MSGFICDHEPTCPLWRPRGRAARPVCSMAIVHIDHVLRILSKESPWDDMMLREVLRRGGASMTTIHIPCWSQEELDEFGMMVLSLPLTMRPKAPRTFQWIIPNG